MQLTDTLAAGTVILDRYVIQRLLGEGGMGAVFAATHVVTGKSVALKFLKATAATNPDLVRRFIREARAASAVQHPNVVAIHDVLTLADGSPVMVMDLLHGESLGDRLLRERTLPLGELSTIMVPVLSAISAAHGLGIVHRDLKPDNIFQARYADGRVESKVLDFGIAKLAPSERDHAQSAALTRTGSILGTPYYMAPEQTFGEKDLDKQADVWALGVILYECLSGTRPFDGDNFGQLLKAVITGAYLPIDQRVSGLPHEVIMLIGRMLTVDRAQRLANVDEAAQVLSPFRGVAPEMRWEAVVATTMPGVPLETSPAMSVTSPDGKKPRRGLFVVASAAVVAVAGAAVGARIVLRHEAGAAPSAAAALSDHLVVPPVSAAPSDSGAPTVSPAVPAVAPTSGLAMPSPSASVEQQKGGPHPGKKKNDTPAPLAASAQPAHPAGTNLPGGVVGANPFQ